MLVLEIAQFIETIDMAVECGFEKMLLTGHIGKLVKVSGGIMTFTGRLQSGACGKWTLSRDNHENLDSRQHDCNCLFGRRKKRSAHHGTI